MENDLTYSEQITETIDQLNRIKEQLRSIETDYLKQKEALWVISEFSIDFEYWQDVKGNFKYVSPSCENLTGYKPKDFYADKNLFKKIIVGTDW